MTRRLVLLRHGQTEWNDSRRAQGHIDIPLDDVGRAQAAAAAPYFAGLALAGIWSSDLSRALETAEIVGAAAGLAVKPDARLREFSLGEAQGLTWPEAVERFPGLPRTLDPGVAADHVPGAETCDDVAARIVPALTEILGSLDEGEAGLVVSHGACLRLAVARLLGWPDAATTALAGLGNCHFAVLEERMSEDRMVLGSYGVPAARW